MDFNKIEDLVVQAKQGSKRAKETLAIEFTPLILNLSKKVHINSYDFQDIKNECYKTLFKCINLYKEENHRFVAYATIAIKNSVKNLFKLSTRRVDVVAHAAYIPSNYLENLSCTNFECIEDKIITRLSTSILKEAINNLDYLEQQLIFYVYFKGYSLKKYSSFRKISYYTALCRKSAVLNKLKKFMNTHAKYNTLH